MLSMPSSILERDSRDRVAKAHFIFTITTSSVPSLRKLTCDRFARGANPEKWLPRLTARAACRVVSSSNGDYSANWHIATERFPWRAAMKWQ